MRKVIVFMLLLCCFIIAPAADCKANQSADILNNKTLSSDKSIKNGNVVMTYYADMITNNVYDDMKVYNISRLDAFIENVNKGKKDKIRIVKYIKAEKQTRVNRLYDLKYDGNKIVDIEYDVYSNPDAFIPFKPFTFHRIIKRDYPDALWYGLCISGKENEDCATLISFHKKSIVD